MLKHTFNFKTKQGSGSESRELLKVIHMNHRLTWQDFRSFLNKGLEMFIHWSWLQSRGQEAVRNPQVSHVNYTLWPNARFNDRCKYSEKIKAKGFIEFTHSILKLTKRCPVAWNGAGVLFLVHPPPPSATKHSWHVTLQWPFLRNTLPAI
jgi:hypothetical protein